MTNIELIQKIKAEIERLKGICTAQIKANPEQTFPFVMEMTGYDKLLSFLSTLESEKPINPEDAMKELDEKIALVKQRGTWDGVDVDKYMDEVRGREPETPKDLEEAAETLAEQHGFVKKPNCKPARYSWSAVRDVFIEGAIAGAKWDRQQMLKEAVEGKVFMSFAPGHNQMVMADVDLPTNTNVRVIVLPKEDGHE